MQIEAGVDGLVACGSTGEAASLSEEEYALVLSQVRETARGRVPCLGGISVSSSARAVEMAKVIEKAGLQGILLAAPPYNKPPQSGIVAHFSAVHSAVSLPIVAYNIPGRSGVNIQPLTIAQLAKEGVIIGLKEASSSLDQALDILVECGERISLLSGEDSLVLALMACGGRGVISATANVAPREFADLTRAALAGAWEEARELQLKLLPLVRCMFAETNPIPLKAALAMRGVIRSSAVRLPLVEAKPETKERIKRVLGC